MEKEVTLVNRLTRELDEMRWEQEAKASIFLEVVDDVAQSSSKMSKHFRTELSKAVSISLLFLINANNVCTCMIHT